MPEIVNHPTKITPGPWKVHGSEIIDAEGRELASIHVDPTSEFPWANADLLATSPDMLEMLMACECLIKENTSIINSIIRHEIHGAEIMMQLSDIAAKWSNHLSEINALTEPWKG